MVTVINNSFFTQVYLSGNYCQEKISKGVPFKTVTIALILLSYLQTNSAVTLFHVNYVNILNSTELPSK